MAVSIDTYKAFKAFTDFALERVNANDGKAIASAKIDAPLGGRKMLAVKHTTADSVHNWTRGFDQWTVNDRTRDIFKDAIVKMFGGESKIPASVRQAMQMEDYGRGKPLTARRILMVKAAIDQTDAPLRDAALKLQAAGTEVLKRLKPETRAALFAKGYTKAELPNVTDVKVSQYINP